MHSKLSPIREQCQKVNVHSKSSPIREHVLGKSFRIAPSLLDLSLNDDLNYIPGVLQLLEIVARKSHDLDLITVNTPTGCASILPALAAFTQIKRLKCHSITFKPDGGDAEHFQNLSALLSLEELKFSGFTWKHSTAQQADILWTTLASLTGLTRLKFEMSYTNPLNLGTSNVCSISRLKTLRSLTLRRLDELPNGAALFQALGAMTQLIHLRLDPVAESALTAIAGLPLLQKLRLGLQDGDGSLASLSLQSPHLTKLTVEGGEWSSASDLLPPSAPALRSLERLSLPYGHLKTFPEQLADALGNLQHLDLTYNDFTSIPLAVTRLTTLQSLNLSCNHHLHLDLDDVDLLQALPNLKSLDLSIEHVDDLDGSIDPEWSLRVLSELESLLPPEGLKFGGYTPRCGFFVVTSESDSEQEGGMGQHFEDCVE